MKNIKDMFQMIKDKIAISSEVDKVEQTQEQPIVRPDASANPIGKIADDLSKILKKSK